MNFKAICADYKTLDSATEKSMLIKAKNGDSNAKQILVNSIMPEIVKYAAKFARKTNRLEVNDFISEGVLGAYRAIMTYDMNSSVKFYTYAISSKGNWVMQYMLQAIRNSPLIPGSTNQKNGTEERFAISSLDESVEDGFTLLDTIPSPEYEVELSDSVNLESLLTKYSELLTDTEQLTLSLMGQGLTCREVGSHLRRSGYGTTLIRDRAINKLRKVLQKEDFQWTYALIS